jgi:transcriptional regulator with XRE-family HTH domain
MREVIIAMVLSKKDLGEKVKAAREVKATSIGNKYTQANLADDIGISRSYLGDIEAGRKYPNYVLLSKIADACNVALDFFDDEELEKMEHEYEMLIRLSEELRVEGRKLEEDLLEKPDQEKEKMLMINNERYIDAERHLHYLRDKIKYRRSSLELLGENEMVNSSGLEKEDVVDKLPKNQRLIKAIARAEDLPEDDIDDVADALDFLIQQKKNKLKKEN